MKKKNLPISGGNKRLLLAVVCLFMFEFVFSQPAYLSNLRWRDTNYGSDIMNKMTATDGKGNIFITGEVKGLVDMDPGPAVYNLNAGTGLAKAVLAKYNSVGGLEWAFLVGGSSNYGNSGENLFLDPSTGDILVSGYIQGGNADFDPGPGVFNLYSSSSPASAFFARYTTDGNFVFAKLLGLSDVAIDQSGNLIIATRSLDNLCLIKLTASGNPIWQMTLQVPQPYGTWSSGPRSVVVDGAGDIIVTGAAYANVDFDPGPGVSSFPTSIFFMAKYNSSGQFVYVKGIAPNGNSGIDMYDMTVDGAGNFTLTGYIHGYDPIDIDAGPGIRNITNQGALYNCGRDILLFKYDNNGNFLWGFSIGGYAPPCNTNVGYEEGKAIISDANGNVYVTGTFSTSSDFDPGPSTFTLPSYGGNIRETFVAKYNPSGQFSWAFKIGSNSPPPSQYEGFHVISESISLNTAGNILVGLYFLASGPIDFDPGSYTANFSNDAGGLSYCVATYVDGKVWNGSSDNMWTNPANWSGNSVPGAGDNVLIPTNGVTNEPQIPVTTQTKNFNVQPGRTLTINNNLNVSGQVYNMGTFANNGTVTATNMFMNTGTYKGTGAFNGSQFYNAATSSVVAPGNSPGCLNFADFKSKGELKIEINGSTPCIDFDRLNVTGTATVQGKLSVNFGFTPTMGQSFQIINAASYNGFFDLIVSNPSWGLSYLNGVVTVIAPLPLKIISFEAIQKNADVLLEWKTIDATNLDRFFIETSTDGIHFTTLGERSAINTNGETVYQLNDLNPTVRGNRIYYRLRIKELDGNTSYSKTLFVQFKNKSSGITLVYPNPSDGIFQVLVSTNTPLILTVTDAVGKQIKKLNINHRGNYQLDLSAESIGIYFIRDDGNSVIKIIRN